MKAKKLLDTLNTYMNPELQKKEGIDVGLSKVLKKLKKKELKLQDKIDRETDGVTRQRMEKDLKLVHAQRKKGIALLKTMRKDEEDTGETA